MLFNRGLPVPHLLRRLLDLHHNLGLLRAPLLQSRHLPVQLLQQVCSDQDSQCGFTSQA